METNVRCGIDYHRRPSMIEAASLCRLKILLGLGVGLGVERVINPTKEDLPTAIDGLTVGKGGDVVIETEMPLLTNVSSRYTASPQINERDN